MKEAIAAIAMASFIAYFVFFSYTASQNASTGWPVVECYDQGKVVFQATYQHCPKFAGTGYSKLQSGIIIKGECSCSMGSK